jgi:hypothetical protein
MEEQQLQKNQSVLLRLKSRIMNVNQLVGDAKKLQSENQIIKEQSDQRERIMLVEKQQAESLRQILEQKLEDQKVLYYYV